jgi:hypothetical protein
MCCAFIAFEKVFDTVLSDYFPCSNGARQRENLLSFFLLYILMVLNPSEKVIM